MQELTNSYYPEIKPQLDRYFEYNQDKLNMWLFCPNYLFGYFSPISLILTGDRRPINWVQRQLDVKDGKKVVGKATLG